MHRLQTRTKFFISRLLLVAGLIGVVILVVRRSVQEHVRKEILRDLLNSTETFQNFEREQELSLKHSAELLANLPTLKALMTTSHEATIQDGSAGLWQLGGTDLFVLGDRTGRVVALHTVTASFSRALAQESLRSALSQEDSRSWWFDGEHLYEVILQPIFFGSASDNSPLGILAVGHEIDERVAQEISLVAVGQVAFRYGSSVLASTLSPVQKMELKEKAVNLPSSQADEPRETRLAGERFLFTTVEITRGTGAPVVMYVLKSYDQAIEFLDSLTRLIIWLGVGAVLVGIAATFLISDTLTRPLNNLVEAVRALEAGNSDYPLKARRRGDELAEVTTAFDKMRQSLRKTQQCLLDAERLATIGRMASSISHDLRHPLTAIVANAEFLCEANLTPLQREELYKEVRLAVDRMTDLIESLLEFSRTRESLHLVRGSVKDVIESSISMIHSRPEFASVGITVTCEGKSECWFDPRKIQRVFDNLLVNACQAVSPLTGRIEVKLREAGEGLEIRVIDNGTGIAEPIRDKLFMPFVSLGKEQGTGLGLTITQKIMMEHGGSVILEASSPGYTAFKLFLPAAITPEDLPRVNFHSPVA